MVSLVNRRTNISFIWRQLNRPSFLPNSGCRSHKRTKNKSSGTLNGLLMFFLLLLITLPLSLWVVIVSRGTTRETSTQGACLYRL